VDVLFVSSSACDAKYEMDHVYEDLVSRATGGQLLLSFYLCLGDMDINLCA